MHSFVGIANHPLLTTLSHDGQCDERGTHGETATRPRPIAAVLDPARGPTRSTGLGRSPGNRFGADVPCFLPAAPSKTHASLSGVGLLLESHRRDLGHHSKPSEIQVLLWRSEGV